ncbi:hypothetical protein BDW68DRAFT_171749 [Aspergillus falconensis]
MYGSGLLNANELARFEFPMTDKLQNPTDSEHKEYSAYWTAAWQAYKETYYKHGKAPGLKDWDISELKAVVAPCEKLRPVFPVRALHTDWDRYWDMPSFAPCYYVGYQRDLWKMAKARQLSNRFSLSNDEWEQILQNFSIFLWFDFYVMGYDFGNPSKTRWPSLYWYAFEF